MHFVQIEDRRYLQLEALRHRTGLVHAWSTRPHDVSPRGDARAPERAANRERMAQDFGFDAARLSFCVQVHGERLELVADESTPGPLEGCDGVATTVRGASLMTFSADCPLVLIFDPHRPAVGLAHASWRCTTAQVTARLVALMESELGCRPSRMLAGIGPAAGPCCYEVGDDVREAARGLPGYEALFEPHGRRWHFDLWQANRRLLEAAGIPADQIEVSDLCTICHPELLYSFRREGRGCGHFGLLAGLAVS